MGVRATHSSKELRILVSCAHYGFVITGRSIRPIPGGRWRAPLLGITRVPCRVTEWCAGASVESAQERDREKAGSRKWFK